MEEKDRIAIAVLEEKARITDASLIRLENKVDAGFARLDAKIDAVRDSVASAKVWALGLYIAFAGAMLAAMARGFGWI